MNFTDNDTSYLLKLDHIDLNYISNLSLQYEAASCPIWSSNSAKNRGNDEFFEFKVMAGKKNDSATESVTSHGDVTIGYPMYRCVMCDRDIPVTYRKEHNGSEKHKTFVKIAEAVLQRIQGHLLAEDKNEIVKDSTHTYFCTHCTIIVKNTDKKLHEASNTHQKSVLHDRYLKDLLNVFLDKDYLDSAEMQYLKPSQEHKDKEDSSPPLHSDSEKENDTKASIVDKIRLHGRNFDEDEETEPVKKPTYGPIILKPLNHSIVNKHDPSNDPKSLLKKKRKKKSKNQDINSKNVSVVEEKNPIQVPNRLMENVSSLFQIRKHALRSNQDNSARDAMIASVANNNCIGDPSDLHSLRTRPCIFDLNEIGVLHNQAMYNQYSAHPEINCSTGDQNDSNDEEYHSLDETSKTGENHAIEDQNDSADEQTLSNDDLNKSNEKQSPIADQININTDQSDETKPNNSTVDYIMLVKSNEFEVDEKKEDKNEKSNVLSEAELEKYLNVIDCHRLTLIKDFVQIETLDKCILTVKADNFNGFCLRDGHLQCRVCMKMVEGDPAEHIYSLDHVTNVGAPFEDFHCFRKVNNTFNHCVHCNDTFSNFDLHKLLESHLTALKEAMSRALPEKPIEPKKVGRTFCEPCNLYIDSHNFNSHTNGKPHKNNLALFFTRDTKKTENVPSTSGKTYCEICKNYVNTANFDVHYKNQHENTETAKNDTKKTKLDEEDKIHCEPCNWQIRKENFQAHLFGKTHQTNVSLANESKASKKDNYCATCDLVTEKLSAHLTGKYHEYHVNKANAAKKKIDGANAPSNLVSGVHVTNQIKHVSNETICTVCYVLVPGTAQNIAAHTQGRPHKTKFNEFVSKNRIVVVNNSFYCQACKCSVGLSKVIDHISSEDHKKANNEEVPTSSNTTSEDNSNNHIKITTDDLAVCRICNAKVPNKPESISEHTKGRTHKMKFNTLMDDNKIKKVNNNFFCEACKVAIEQSKELEHIKTATHKISLAQYIAKPQPPTLFHCESCEVDIINTPTAIQEHEEAIGHKISEAFYTVARGLMDNSVHYHYERVPNSETLSCRLCDITVSVENSKKHLESPAHNFKYRATLNENKVQKVSNKYFCQICSVEVQNRDELKHIRSLTHLFEKQACLSVNSQASSVKESKRAEYRCPVCQVEVPNCPKNIHIHEQGSAHMAKLKSLSLEDEEKVLLTKTGNGRQMMCSLCKAAVPVNGVSDHVRGARHRANKVVATTKPTAT
ncbi:hypothetical protein ABMA28_012638 [Loxostege sticticalis]|uniref:C2H2-type domain-containing protein n=1 Tax=Loxostege sticticalis TaxID=481309 RepID=A0ABD0S8D8_LOXSC